MNGYSAMRVRANNPIRGGAPRLILICENMKLADGIGDCEVVHSAGAE